MQHLLQSTRVCQQFDCRVFLLLGCGMSDPMVQEALRQWEPPSIKTAEDRATLTSLRLAVEGGPTMPPVKDEIEALHRAMNWRSYLPLAKALLRRGR